MAGFRASESSVDPLANDPSLGLRKYTQHLKHCLAGGRRTIASLLVKKKADSLFEKALEYAEQVGERWPSRFTDHVATMSTLSRSPLSSCHQARALILPFAPLMPVS